MIRTVAIIQARVSSLRLPGKVFADIHGKPMLQRVYERVKKANLLDDVVIATSFAEEDYQIVQWGQANGILVYRGGNSENDVLGRYWDVAQNVKADVIVRITADCPMHDAGLIDRCIRTFAEVPTDYLCNTEPIPTFPDGLDVEVFSRTALEEANTEAHLPSDREHVTPWMRRGTTGGLNVSSPIDLGHYRWTVDEPADLEFVRAVYTELGEDFDMNDVLALLERKPELVEINAHIGRNEGYMRSLEEETHAKDTTESTPNSGDL